MICLINLVLLFNLASAGIFSKKNVLLRSLKTGECPDSYNPGVVLFRNVNIATTAEGDLVVSGSFSTAVNITSPLKIDLEIARIVYGVPIPVPCIMRIGSCTYEDICKYGISNDKQCPGALDENDVPCRCPIQKGLYNLPGAQFPLPATRLAYFIAGKYRGTVRFIMNTRLLACYRILMELQ